MAASPTRRSKTIMTETGCISAASLRAIIFKARTICSAVSVSAVFTWRIVGAMRGSTKCIKLTRKTSAHTSLETDFNIPGLLSNANMVARAAEASDTSI